MASQSAFSSDPASETDRANYDYVSDEVARPDLMTALERRVDGDVRFDTYSRQLYATDASAYEMVPVGVVFPRSTDDVAAVMGYCAEQEIPVLPRGGGTSLAGQAVNEAVVLDFTKYMNELRSVDPDERTAVTQPGAVLGDVNEQLAEHGLKFAPDPAWGDKSTIGGAIGNNSTGAHSLVYGKTDAYIEECQVVLADGTVTRLGEVSVDELRADADPDANDLIGRIYADIVRIIDEEREEIERQYPDLKRNVAGYNLDTLIEEAKSGRVNLARLLAGSEGTLAVVTEATVSLEPIPETKAVALLTYDSLLDAVADVKPILEHDPAAIEVMDDVLLDLARETEEFADVVEMLPEGTDSVLLVEFYAESDADGRGKVADLIHGRVDSRQQGDQRANSAMEAHDPERRARFWKLRKSGLPILLSRTSDAKHISFIEDTAVPPEQLPAYVSDVQSVLDEHETFASYYAHAGPGVLHIRPLINTKTIEGTEQMVSIAERVTDLVSTYGGSISGEHGDGHARTQWNRRLYGERLWSVFRDLKRAFDPDWLLNPGSVCGDWDMSENLRFDPEYEFEAGFEPSLEWSNENGFQGMAELCHGCGGCRGEQATTGGVMCPTYRAAEEEIQSTRGRANMLRAVMAGQLTEEQFSEEFIHEVFDVCIGCKGCLRDCPSGVDMAKMKAEVEHEHHQRHGASLRDRIFANIDSLSRLGSALAPLSNWLASVPGSGKLLEQLGIAPERELPTFHRESLIAWFEKRGSLVPPSEAIRTAVVFPDTYTNYNHPESGKAAVRVLEAAGVHVEIPAISGSGRPPLSKGFIEKSRRTAKGTIAELSASVEKGWDVVIVEPSDAVMFQLDYLDLLSGSAVESVAENTYGVMEYLDRFRLDEELSFETVDTSDESVTYHGHCHQKATKKDHHAVGVLRRAGYSVDPLDSGCCGMAGSFGYENEHYSMSKAIARILYDQVDESDGNAVVAPGASCRAQLGDHVGEKPPHPIEMVDEILDESETTGIRGGQES